MAADNFQDRLALIEDELSALSGKSDRSMQMINGLMTENKAQHLIRRVIDESEMNARRLRSELDRRLRGLGDIITSDNISEYLIDLEASEGSQRNTTYFSAKGSVDHVLDNDNGICEISWSDIEVVAYDGARFSFSSETYVADLYQTDTVFYFLGNRIDNVIQVVSQSEYQENENLYEDIFTYILLWTVTFNSSNGGATFSVDFDYPPFAAPLFSPAPDELGSIIEGFKIQSLSVLGQTYNEEVNAIVLDQEYPLRVDLPIGTRIEIGSINAIVRVFTAAGSYEIPIIEQRVEENKGALIRFNLDYLQVQLQAQPDRIRAYVESVDQTTQAQLELIQTNQSAIASITTSLNANDINATGSFKQLVERIDSDLGSLTVSSTTIENILQANNFTLNSNISSRVALAEDEAGRALTSTIEINNSLTGGGFGTFAQFVSRVTENEAEILNRVSNDVSGAEAIFQLMANDMTSTAKLKAENINIDGVVNFINDGVISTKITKDGIDTISIAADTAFLSQLAAKNIVLTGSISGNYDPAQYRGWLIDGLGNATFNDVVIRGDVYTTKGEIGGNIVTDNALSSTHFEAGESGWRISSLGNAEFNNVTVRGALIAGLGSSIDIDYVNIANASIDFASIDLAEVRNLSAINTNTGSLTVTGLLNIDPAEGALNFGNFSVDGQGNMTATNANVTGQITATSGSFSGTVNASSGSIGGWNLTSNYIASSKDGRRIELDQVKDRVSIMDHFGLIELSGSVALSTIDVANNEGLLHTIVSSSLAPLNDQLVGSSVFLTSGSTQIIRRITRQTTAYETSTTRRVRIWYEPVPSILPAIGSSVVVRNPESKIVMGYLEGLPRNNGFGTVSSRPSTTSLRDDSKEWRDNELMGLTLIFNGSNGTVYELTIVSNTSDTINWAGESLSTSITGSYEVRYIDSNYGFWARNGDQLHIDGDLIYEGGDWIVQQDGRLRIINSRGADVITLGLEDGKRGLFIKAGNDLINNTLLARFVNDGLLIGDPNGTHLSYNLTEGLKISGGLQAATGTFKGELQAATGTFTGGVTATSLTLTGDMTITDTGGINVGSGAFTVSSAGALKATDADVTGEINATSGTLGGLEVTSTITVSGFIESANPWGWKLGASGYINKQSGAQSGFFFNKTGFLPLSSFDGIYINDNCYFGGEYQDVQSMSPAVKVISGTKEFVFNEIQDEWKIQGFDIVSSAISNSAIATPNITNGTITNSDISTNQTVIVTNVAETDASEYGYSSCWVKGTIRGAFKSSDNSSGKTVTRSFEDSNQDTHTQTFKDGILTSWKLNGTEL